MNMVYEVGNFLRRKKISAITTSTDTFGKMQPDKYDNNLGIFTFQDRYVEFDSIK